MRTILLVDDEPEVLSTLRDTLESFGYRVIPEPDAESALSELREQNEIDLVVTDLWLPGLSGIEFIAELKKILPKVPVIMLTAHGSVESYFRARSYGVFEYVNKPVRAKELDRIVEAALAWSTVDSSSKVQDSLSGFVGIPTR